jgi:hypothetical protein
MRNLECAKCRTKTGLNLFTYDKKKIDPEKYSVDQLKTMIPRMDTWCNDCGVVFNTRITGPGRLKHKEEAAYIADLKIMGDRANIYDDHMLDQGFTKSKQDIIREVKDRPCAVCGVKYHPCAMDFHHVAEKEKRQNVGVMVGPTFTIKELIEEIQKCVVLCATCHRLVTHHIIASPKERITLDENFFDSIF